RKSRHVDFTSGALRSRPALKRPGTADVDPGARVMASIFLVLNAGSSSLKFKVFSLGAGAEPQATIKGMFEGLGGAARFRAFDTAGSVLDDLSWRSGKA